MPRSPQAFRFAAPLSAIVLVAAVSGCSMFGEKDELYTQSTESRPLEVPPDLDRPSADRAMSLPATGGAVSASAMNNAGGGSAAPIGFNASGDRDAIFAKVPGVRFTVMTISTNSLGIYFVHVLVIEALAAGWLKLTLDGQTFLPMVAIPVVAAITVAISAAITATLKKIPVLRHAVP